MVKTTDDHPIRLTFDEHSIPALRLVRISRLIRNLGKIILVGLICSVIAMVFLPWQQSAKGTGNVIAYAPRDRQQIIEAPIKGRIVSWGENLYENALLQKGDLIAEIRDLDEDYSDRLDQQLEASREGVRQSQSQLNALNSSLDAAHTVVESYEEQVIAYTEIKAETISAQDAYVAQAREKLQGSREQLVEYQAQIPQLEAELNRMRTLEQEDNISLQKVQEVEAKYNGQVAKVNKARTDVAAFGKELEAKIAERSAKIQKAQVDIDYAKALVRKATADMEKAKSDVAKASQELAKANEAVLKLESSVARQKNQVVAAPFDGYVLNILPNFGTGVLKEGDPICTIVPITEERAVQIWLDGNDAPLIEKADHVRLQFEGWPAIQFAGWPAVAVGTFGGEVESVDSIDDGKGKFRTVVRPTDSTNWPKGRYLRQGTRVNGWVMLDTVPLWYEVWRQLNGFPPTVDNKDEKSSKGDSGKNDSGKKSKPPLPK